MGEGIRYYIGEQLQMVVSAMKPAARQQETLVHAGVFSFLWLLYHTLLA